MARAWRRLPASYCRAKPQRRAPDGVPLAFLDARPGIWPLRDQVLRALLGRRGAGVLRVRRPASLNRLFSAGSDTKRTVIFSAA
jgi:hypothetical protein